MMRWMLALSFGLTFELAGAASMVQPMSFKFTDPVVVTGSAVTRLKAMRSAYRASHFNECLTEATKSKAAAKSLEPWIALLELECASKLLQANMSKAALNRAAKVQAAFATKTSWLAMGPWAQRLRSEWARLSLLAIEAASKSDRDLAWSMTETLSARADLVLDSVGRAKLWRLAGEVLFAQQKLEAAREFFRRSLAEADQPDLRERLKLLDASGEAKPVTGAPSATASAPTPLGPNPAESELLLRIETSLKSGDLISSAEDSAQFLRDYPGSSRSKWVADRLQDSLITVGEKSLAAGGETFVPVRDALLRAMEKTDAERLQEWTRVLFNKGLWPEAARLGRAAASLATTAGGSRSTKVLELALEAAYATDDFKAVRLYGEELAERHSGTSASREALLLMALASFRQGDDARVISLLERLLASVSLGALGDALEVQARYWLWRGLERIKSDKAAAAASELMQKFPFSYYGLRARLEVGAGKLEWPPAKTSAGKVESKLWLTQDERQSWERATVLISAGWFEEAQEELRRLPLPTTPEAKAVRARIWGLAKGYLMASRLANDAWDTKFDLRRLDLMRFVWPDEHRSLFESAAKAKSIDSLVTRSLTKQESGYNPKAVSSSGALGLMQMIPPTAREIADDLKLGRLNLPDDLFEPERNIPMGTHYIAKMLTQFKGHLPLALAAYNAGPVRLERWLGARASLKDLAQSRSSAPESEIWFDEFPYGETSFYVKAILRNMLLYRLLEEGSVTIPVSGGEPLWKGTRP